MGTYPGAVVMVTHDEGAVDAPRPDRVPLLPEAEEDLAEEDLWDGEHRGLVVPRRRVIPGCADRSAGHASR